jgi:hypothetical protein
MERVRTYDGHDGEMYAVDVVSAEDLAKQQ